MKFEHVFVLSVRLQSTILYHSLLICEPLHELAQPSLELLFCVLACDKSLFVRINIKKQKHDSRHMILWNGGVLRGTESQHQQFMHLLCANMRCQLRVVILIGISTWKVPPRRLGWSKDGLSLGTDTVAFGPLHKNLIRENLTISCKITFLILLRILVKYHIVVK